MRRILVIVFAFVVLIPWRLFATDLVGLSWNQNIDSPQWDLVTVNPSTGRTMSLNSLPDVPIGGGFTVALDGSRVFVRGGSLYQFELPSGRLIRTTSLSVSTSEYILTLTALSADTLLGVSHNFTTDTKQLITVDARNGQTQVLNRLSFARDLFYTSRWFTVAPNGTRAFALSNSNTLYVFRMPGGELISSSPLNIPTSLDLQAIRALSVDTLMGVAYNRNTQRNELRSIAVSTGQSTLLKSFTLDTGWNFESFTLDPVARRAFLVSGDQGDTLYEFDLTNGNLSTRRSDRYLAFLGAVVEEEAVVPTTSFVVGMGSNPTTSSFEQAPAHGNLPTARVPLGSVFFIKLVQGATSNGSSLKSFFTLHSAQINPDLSEPALFPNNVLIAFEEPLQPAEYAVFQAVHRGTVTLNIAPEGQSSSPFRLTVEVTSPRSLGTTYPSIDAALVDLGHRRGIPPHLLKGQVERESSFTPTGYRYEPLSVDKAWISRGQNLRETHPYLLYRMATDDGLSQGVDILNADIEPRSCFFVVRDGVRRLITPEDSYVSAKEIYQENDSLYRWSAFSPATAAEVQGNPAVLDFTAQTPLASSFGYLQILYSTADKPMWWNGIDGQKNPSYLFDTEYNRQHGGGSLALGTAYLRRIFSTANPEIDVSSPKFANPAALEKAFTRALGSYNGRIDSPYGNAVLNFARAYLPIGGKIFP